MNLTPDPGTGRSQLDKLLFVGILLAGIAAIILLKVLGAHQLLVTVPPALLIMIYALLVSQVKYFRLREDRAGDNCYYLGFLFTLCSLAIALIQFLGQRNVDDLIGNFGIALFTTIVGIGCRVLLGQFREEPPEVEQEVRVELAEAAGRFKAALDNAVVDLDTFRRANQQVVQDALVQHRTFFTEQAELLGGATKEAVVGLTEAATEFTGQAAAFNEQAKRLVLALRRLDAKITAIDVPPDLVARHLAPLYQAVAQLSQRLTERAELEGHSSATVEQLLNRLNTTGEQLVARNTQLLGVLDGLRPVADKLRLAVGQQADLTARHVQDLAGALDGERSTRDELRAAAQLELKATVAALEAWRRTLGEAEGAERASIARRHTILAEEQGRLVADMTAHRQALHQQLELSRALLRQFEDGLVAVADAITRRVDGGQPPYGRG